MATLGVLPVTHNDRGGAEIHTLLTPSQGVLQPFPGSSQLDRRFLGPRTAIGG